MSKKGIICVCPMDVHTRNLRQKAEKRLALRKPRVLRQKYGGACTTYQLGVPKLRETEQEIDSLAAEKGHEESSK